MSMHSPRETPAFTLVELLVVIAVIAILSGILLPALNKSREYAKGIACLSNFRQIAVATNGYVNDYAGWLPLLNTDEGGNFAWKSDLAPYLGMNYEYNQYEAIVAKFPKCPLWNHPEVPWYAVGGYGWNYNWMGYMSGSTRPRIRLSEVTRPTESILCGDGLDSIIDGTWDYSMLYWPSTGKGVGSRHQRGINLMWADGHASHMLRSALMAGKNGDVNWYYTKVK